MIFNVNIITRNLPRRTFLPASIPTAPTVYSLSVRNDENPSIVIAGNLQTVGGGLGGFTSNKRNFSPTVIGRLYGANDAATSIIKSHFMTAVREIRSPLL